MKPIKQEEDVIPSSSLLPHPNPHPHFTLSSFFSSSSSSSSSPSTSTTTSSSSSSSSSSVLPSISSIPPVSTPTLTKLDYRLLHDDSLPKPNLNTVLTYGRSIIISYRHSSPNNFDIELAVANPNVDISTWENELEKVLLEENNNNNTTTTTTTTNNNHNNDNNDQNESQLHHLQVAEKNENTITHQQHCHVKRKSSKDHHLDKSPQNNKDSLLTKNFHVYYYENVESSKVEYHLKHQSIKPKLLLKSIRKRSKSTCKDLSLSQEPFINVSPPSEIRDQSGKKLKDIFCFSLFFSLVCISRVLYSHYENFSILFIFFLLKFHFFL